MSGGIIAYFATDYFPILVKCVYLREFLNN